MSDRKVAHPMRAGLYKMRGVLARNASVFASADLYVSVFRALHGGRICIEIHT